MANGPKMAKPRGYIGDVAPNSYPVDHTGPAPKPARTAEPVVDKELHLMVDAHGTPQQVGPPAKESEKQTETTVQSSAPPAQPEAAAEDELFKKRYGDLVNRLGEMERKHAQEKEEMRLMMQLNQQTGRIAAQAPVQIPQGLDPEQELKIKDLYAALPHIHQAAAETAQAQAIRATWDVSPEEEAEITRDFPQLQNLGREADRLSFIQNAARSRRKFKEEQAPPVSQAPPEPLPQYRPAPATVPQPEAAPSAPVADAQPENAYELASQAYRAAEARLGSATTDQERKQILREMREARDIVLRAQGITEEIERELPIRKMSR